MDKIWNKLSASVKAAIITFLILFILASFIWFVFWLADHKLIIYAFYISGGAFFLYLIWSIYIGIKNELE